MPRYTSPHFVVVDKPEPNATIQNENATAFTSSSSSKYFIRGTKHTLLSNTRDTVCKMNIPILYPYLSVIYIYLYMALKCISTN